MNCGWGFSQRGSKLELTHTELKCDFEKMWVNMDIGTDIFAYMEKRGDLSNRKAGILVVKKWDEHVQNCYTGDIGDFALPDCCLFFGYATQNLRRVIIKKIAA